MVRGQMPSVPLDMTVELPAGATAGVYGSSEPSELEGEVVGLFDAFQDRLLRYALSLGLSSHDGEEIIQETFLALFRHLQLGKSRKNLRGWIFRVTHNLALKHRHANQRLQKRIECGESIMERQPDPAPDPEEQMMGKQRQSQLRAVLRVLPEQERYCLYLRAEGLRYREIASVLGMSLGAVAVSLARSIARLQRADGGQKYAE
jgi:RNA polymerase sigma-70 factor (ECF subfamily)